MAGKEEADPHGPTDPPAPTAIPPRTRAAGSPDGGCGRRVLVRLTGPAGRAPAWARWHGPCDRPAHAGAERSGHDRLRALHAGPRRGGARPDPPPWPRWPEHRAARSDGGEPASVRRVHALPAADHPDEERGRGGGSRGRAACAHQVRAMHAPAQHQHARPHNHRPAQPRNRARNQQQLRPVLAAVQVGGPSLQALPAGRSARQRNRPVNRKLAIPGALIAAGLAGVVATVAVIGGTPAPAATPRVRTSTATVMRTNLATKVLTAGTLGYAA